jgi:MSHA biogenesis protein MshN
MQAENSKSKSRQLIINFCFLIAIVLLLLHAPLIHAIEIDPEDSNNKPRFFKQKLAFSNADLANLAYAKCLELIASGKDVEAVQKLQVLIEKIPNYTPARLKLISLYRDIGWDSEAVALLEEGLQIDANNPKFLLTKADIMLRQNKAEQALALLLKVSNAANAANQSNDSVLEQKALLAKAYFDLALYDLASKNYNFLIKSDMRNSKWWLGYALSLDYLGETQDAIKSFSRVKSLGGLEPDVLRYVNSRLEFLVSRN